MKLVEVVLTSALEGPVNVYVLAGVARVVNVWSLEVAYAFVDVPDDT